MYLKYSSKLDIQPVITKVWKDADYGKNEKHSLHIFISLHIVFDIVWFTTNISSKRVRLCIQKMCFYFQSANFFLFFRQNDGLVFGSLSGNAPPNSSVIESSKDGTDIPADLRL